MAHGAGSSRPALADQPLCVTEGKTARRSRNISHDHGWATVAAAHAGKCCDLHQSAGTACNRTRSALEATKIESFPPCSRARSLARRARARVPARALRGRPRAAISKFCVRARNR